MPPHPKQHPNVKVVTGPMRCGKSTEVMRLIQRASIARKRVLVGKPKTDDRTPHVSRRVMDEAEQESWVHRPATVLETPEDMERFLAADADLYILDEAQFFLEPWSVQIVTAFLDRRAGDPIQLIISGLDLDFARRPFGMMPQFLALADDVLKLTGICTRCGSEDGRFTQRLSAEGDTVVVGDKNYTVRCRNCHEILTPPEIPPAP